MQQGWAGMQQLALDLACMRTTLGFGATRTGLQVLLCVHMMNDLLWCLFPADVPALPCCTPPPPRPLQVLLCNRMIADLLFLALDTSNAAAVCVFLVARAGAALHPHD
jgi:hypothetical protein